MAVDALTTIGAAIADRTRATVLVALMDGRARTAGELASHARVAPSTMSEHLARLERAGLVEVAAQGRHRYFRLTSGEIAAVLETLGTLDVPRPTGRLGSAPEELRFARTCYDHLAGTLAVTIRQRLVDRGDLDEAQGGVQVTPSGRTALAELGVEVDASGSRPSLRPCLDWTERRDHLAGPVAASLLDALIGRNWIARGGRPRSIRVTAAGRRGLGEWLGTDLARPA